MYSLTKSYIHARIFEPFCSADTFCEGSAPNYKCAVSKKHKRSFEAVIIEVVEKQFREKVIALRGASVVGNVTNSAEEALEAVESKSAPSF